MKFFTSGCRTHNPFIAGDVAALTKGMAAASAEEAPRHSDQAFTVEHVLVDGEMVAVHTHMLGSRTRTGDGGLRQVRLFRFDGDEIVESWVTTQSITPELPKRRGCALWIPPVFGEGFRPT